jgi:hypothetical protein
MRRLLLPIALLASTPAWAHGLLMKLDAQGDAIAGQLYFSNGQRAGGVWVELFDAAAPDAAVETLQTAPDGSFRVKGAPGHRYEVRATGDEGHSISMAIALDQPAAHGTMIADPGDERPTEIPAWAILGGLLALSILPALWLRRKRMP